MPARTSSTPSPPSCPNESLVGLRAVVMGLGRFGGGVGAARWLASRGARVRVTDLAGEDALGESIRALADCPVEYRLGRHDLSDLDHTDLLIVSPAVCKERSDFFQEAVRRGIDWTTEMNLFLSRCRARVVGVTGTAGKSTTASMLHAILKKEWQSGSCHLGGNIGVSLLDRVDGLSAEDIVVLELSSFQLADLPRIDRRPDLAVIVSLWPNHLDRHGTFDAYVDCKLNLLRVANARCGESEAARSSTEYQPGIPVICGVDDPALCARIRDVAGPRNVCMVTERTPGREYALRVPGPHNQRNAACAAAAAAWLGIDDDAIGHALGAYTGLPHRLEFVAGIDGVDYYNDSKSTTAEATIAALRSFDRPIVLLAGGMDRGTDHRALAAGITAYSRVAVCIGPAGAALHSFIRSIEPVSDGLTACHVGGLNEAVAAAHRLARAGDVVLLSPGFPSYDAFANYEHRGQAFTALVRALRKASG